MTIERMSQEKWGYRLLLWKKKPPRLGHAANWKDGSEHRLAIRLYRDSYGVQFSVTLA